MSKKLLNLEAASGSSRCLAGLAKFRWIYWVFIELLLSFYWAVIGESRAGTFLELVVTLDKGPVWDYHSGGNSKATTVRTGVFNILPLCETEMIHIPIIYSTLHCRVEKSYSKVKLEDKAHYEGLLLAPAEDQELFFAFRAKKRAY